MRFLLREPYRDDDGLCDLEFGEGLWQLYNAEHKYEPRIFGDRCTLLQYLESSSVLNALNGVQGVVQICEGFLLVRPPLFFKQSLRAGWRGGCVGGRVHEVLL